jgi:replicative DNA helicase
MARDIRSDIKEYKIVKEGTVHLFNSGALSQASNEPIFIVEGEIDAMSIIEAGGEAIGLGGISNVNRLISELEKKRESSRERFYIICLDNDKGGEETSKKLQEMLKTKGFAFEDKSKELNGTFKDPNEALVKKREEFIVAIKDIKLQVIKNLKEEKENYIQDYMDKVSGIKESFFIEKKTIETGLAELDEFLDGGLYVGLYVLVAAPSAGKTTFALQIADNMANDKQDVLFFSGEMTINEMVAKSVSRLSKETSKDNNKDALTMRTVLNVTESNNSDYKNRVKNLMENVYSKLAKHIRIYDGLQEIEDIENKIAQHKRITGNSPVVFIDYLQIIKSKSGSSSEKRLQIDEIVSQLRILAAQYGIPIFVISSANRDTYKKDITSKRGEEKKAEDSDTKPITLASAKESGGIDFGADVIIGLNTREGQDINDKRGVMVRILKNRTGQRHTGNQCIELEYYARFNYFSNDKTTTVQENNAKTTGNNNKKERNKGKTKGKETEEDTSCLIPR